MKRILFVPLACLFLAATVSAQTTQNAVRFPLPTRETRLVEEAKKPQADADVLIEYISTHPPGTADYSAKLIQLANTQDRRVLTLIETYLNIESAAYEHDPLFNNYEVMKDKQVLAEMYWQLKLQDTTLEQKIATFVETVRATDANINARSAGMDPTIPRPIERLRMIMAKQGESIIRPMVRLLQDKNSPPSLREEAAGVLMDIRHAAAMDALAKVAEDPAEEESLRDLMLQMLAKRGYPKATQAILQTLDKGSRGEAPFEAVMMALYSVEDLAKAGVDKRQWENAVLPYLMAADWKKNSFPAVSVVREFGGEKSIEPLINIAQNGTAPNQNQQNLLRNTALMSVGFVAKAAPEKALPFLIGKSYDKDPVVRIAVVQALSRVGNQMVIPVLVDLVKKETDSNALHFEVSGIYLAGGEPAVKALEELKLFPHEHHRAWLRELTEEGLMRLEFEKRNK